VKPGELDAVFAAVADPTRRHLLERLTLEGPETATNLVADLAVSRQGEVRYAATPAPLQPALAWLVQAGAGWDRRLDRLRTRARERAGH
jgi:hypothetical protein